MNKNLILAAAILIILTACGRGNKNKNTETQNQRRVTFTMPEVPFMISSPQERAEYLSVHYWDNFDFTDTLYKNNPEVTEQAFVDYINSLTYAQPSSAYTSMKETMAKAEADTGIFSYFTRLANKYLYDPNSPMRNEELYIPVLEQMIASENISELEKERPRHRLKMAMNNRVGQKAIDFNYTTSRGEKSTLYKIEAPYLILFINNPGCTACKGYIEKMMNSWKMDSLFKGRIVKVLALYTDENIAEWVDYAPQIPFSWINAYNPDLKIRDGELYDLKAIPTLYLLDKDKKVLLKDTTVEAIENFFTVQEPVF